NGLAVRNDVSSRRQSALLSKQHNTSGVLDVNQIQPTTGWGIDGLPGEQIGRARNSSRSIQAGQTQDDCLRSETAGLQQLLRRQTRLAALARRLARRKLVHLIAGSVA